MGNEKLYVHYGCGLAAPIGWRNYDASPTLRIQKNPLLGILLKRKLNVIFPKNVEFGDIIKGLPIADNCADGVYCSHTLEHLSLTDFRVALNNTYKILKKGGIFRCVVPDLEWSAREYIKLLDEGNDLGSIQFMKETLLGVETRPKGLSAILGSVFGNHNHLWMWDHASLTSELQKAGFIDVRKAEFNDSEDEMFTTVEDQGRFVNAVALECRK